MHKEDEELLEENGWIVECESPFEIRCEDGGAFASGLAAQIILDDLKHERDNAFSGAFASGFAAQIILDDLKHERDNAFSEQDMHDCFNAGVNRGITISAIITKRDLGEEFPQYKDYMENKYKKE